MGACCVEELPIWIFGAIAIEDEEAGLVFGAISTVKSVLKMMKMEKKSFKLFLTLDTKLDKEEESNDDSWKNVVFYKNSDPQRYATHVSRPNPCPTRGLHLKWTRISHVKGKMSPQLHQTRGNVPRMRDSRLTKIASLQRSHLFSKTKAASS